MDYGLVGAHHLLAHFSGVLDNGQTDNRLAHRLLCLLKFTAGIGSFVWYSLCVLTVLHAVNSPRQLIFFITFVLLEGQKRRKGKGRRRDHKPYVCHLGVCGVSLLFVSFSTTVCFSTARPLEGKRDIYRGYINSASYRYNHDTPSKQANKLTPLRSSSRPFNNQSTHQQRGVYV